MATLRMSEPWRDPRTGIYYLRKRVPQRFRTVAGTKAETIKISLGTSDRREAIRRWPDVLRQWADREAAWERKLNAVALTPDRAQEIAARWAAWITSGATLDTGGEDSDVFEPLTLPEAQEPGPIARMWDRVEAHAAEAMALAGVDVVPETLPHLLNAMLPVVSAAYLRADLAGLGTSKREPVGTREELRVALPAASNAPMPRSIGGAPAVPFKELFERWRAAAVVKPRTVEETRYILESLKGFLGHDDARRLTRDDMARWRDASKAEGLTNNTWNNRLSMVRQVFAFAVDNRQLDSNPAETTLRLKKNKVAARHPYTDEDAALILRAARKETKPSLRWAHWVMAFTGMRVGEVMQLTGRDVRQDGGIWFLDVNEDAPGKTVKTGQRRHVPVHPALVAEGFVAYAQTVPAEAPLFPDKALDKFGNRGGRSWNVVGKWVREVVGIKDPQKAPNHAWRHRVEDELRAAEVPEDVRDAIVGHARKTTGRQYGVRGEALARLSRALAGIPSPLGA